jgi:nitric oxide dioxygenase
MGLSQEQVQLIKATVPALQAHGQAITTLFYKTVLEEHPSLHSIFNQTNQENNHQAQALAGALYGYAVHIDDLGILSPTVEKICQKHVSLYIQPKHYAIVGEGLLRAMGSVLGSALTPEILVLTGRCRANGTQEAIEIPCYQARVLSRSRRCT